MPFPTVLLFGCRTCWSRSDSAGFAMPAFPRTTGWSRTARTVTPGSGSQWDRRWLIIGCLALFTSKRRPCANEGNNWPFSGPSFSLNINLVPTWDFQLLIWESDREDVVDDGVLPTVNSTGLSLCCGRACCWRRVSSNCKSLTPGDQVALLSEVMFSGLQLVLVHVYSPRPCCTRFRTMQAPLTRWTRPSLVSVQV